MKSKDIVEVVAIVAASVIVVAAMVFDGKTGDAVGTLILTGGTAIVSYYFGQRKAGTVKTDSDPDQVRDV